MITNGENVNIQIAHSKESEKRAVRYRSAITVALYGLQDRFIQGANADQSLGRRRSGCLVKSDASAVKAATVYVSPILPQGAAIQGIPVGNGSCCAQSNAGLDNEYPEHVDDTWIPGEPPQSLIPPEPFEPVIPSISDEAQLYMQILDPSLIADLEFDAWFNHVPEQPDSGTFDPALLDFTPLTFDGHQNREEGFMSPHLGRQWTEREMGDGSDVPALTKEA
ncbi:hypothetical protein CEP54_011436 [Fusarium duplospermum]|uniref:Uncharacterized protein n=1 Tax=Fusarium duplospermum TaxID=1325734 RepID=A0A428PEF5_9HYPO|nr:hypothetical protein CEP54_011436 [Fusarium duplospermum]